MGNIILEYKLGLNAKRTNMIIPPFIDDGGYFMHGDVLIGISYDKGKYVRSSKSTISTKYHRPTTSKKGGKLNEYTRAELIERQKKLGMKDLDENGDEYKMTDKQIEDFVNKWCTAKGVD